jgi:hypothetical protein
MSATLLLAALVVAQPTSTITPIKFDVKPGTKLTYKYSASTVFDGMGQVFNTTSKQTQTQEVESVTDGWARVKTTIDEFSVQTEMPFGEAPDPTGLATSVLVSPSRKQKEWKVVSNGKLSTGQVDVLSAGAKNDIESGFDGLLFHEGDVEVGTSWVAEHAPAGAGMGGMPTTVTGKVKTTFKVLELKDGIALIEGVTAGNYKMNIETPQGSFGLDVTTAENKRFSVRVADGVITKIETTSNQTLGSDFGEFTVKTTATTELARA